MVVAVAIVQVELLVVQRAEVSTKVSHTVDKQYDDRALEERVGRKQVVAEEVLDSERDKNVDSDFFENFSRGLFDHVGFGVVMERSTGIARACSS